MLHAGEKTNNSYSGKKSSWRTPDFKISAAAGCYLSKPNQEVKLNKFSTIKAFTKRTVWNSSAEIKEQSTSLSSDNKDSCHYYKMLPDATTTWSSVSKLSDLYILVYYIFLMLFNSSLVWMYTGRGYLVWHAQWRTPSWIWHTNHFVSCS